METNPRWNSSMEWAPPPPVADPGQVVVPRRPLVGSESSEQEEFETTLSTLVDQFTSLPPPAYGEPPEMATPSKRRAKGASVASRTCRSRRMRIVGWAVTACLVLAGGVSIGMYFGLKGSQAQAARSAVLPTVEPVITVKSTHLDEAAPVVQPLSDEAVASASEPAADGPVVSPLEEEQVQTAAPAQPSKPVISSARREKPRAKRVRRPTVTKRPLKATVTKRPLKATPSAGDWENPYE